MSAYEEIEDRLYDRLCSRLRRHLGNWLYYRLNRRLRIRLSTLLYWRIEEVI